MTKIGNWFQTYTGKAVYPMSLEVEDICIEDIAHSLSMQCRYNGHSRLFYSIAEHCILMTQKAPPEYALEVLLHDASEAYLTDVPSPIKPFLTNYRDIEKAAEEVIAKKFKLQYPFPQIVKDLDMSILNDEKDFFMGEGERDWNLKAPYLDVEFLGLSCYQAKKKFLQLYKELKRD